MFVLYLKNWVFIFLCFYHFFNVVFVQNLIKDYVCDIIVHIFYIEEQYILIIEM